VQHSFLRENSRKFLGDALERVDDILAALLESGRGVTGLVGQQ
jgi:hypothetical protein